ncbi:MAG: SDR family oxidoreductase [Deltaproteobacteria bacterium]|nr:MAG: SDR family oxidoreductase [Deltaproteobacteria bacterium]
MATKLSSGIIAFSKSVAREIAHAILFLCGQRSSFVTGQILSVSGGLTMAG